MRASLSQSTFTSSSFASFSAFETWSDGSGRLSHATPNASVDASAAADPRRKMSRILLFHLRPGSLAKLVTTIATAPVLQLDDLGHNRSPVMRRTRRCIVMYDHAHSVITTKRLRN